MKDALNLGLLPSNLGKTEHLIEALDYSDELVWQRECVTPLEEDVSFASENLVVVDHPTSDSDDDFLNADLSRVKIVRLSLFLRILLFFLF